MKKIQLLFIGTFMFCVSQTGLSQTPKTIDSLATQYQNCLDKGEYMLGCSQTFYFQMDSILNVVYFNRRTTLDTSRQAQLKAKQKLWLVKRDAYFKKTLKEFKRSNPTVSPFGSANGARDDAMIMFDNNAEIVKARILELLKRLNK